jgi:prepilin-type N-terminal cleavage/methylation domain-containing protein
MTSPNRAFSFVEVLCVVLILSVGMLSAIALLQYGVRLSKEAQSAALAYPTARMLLVDTSPAGVSASEWGPKGGDVWEGFVNGLWARRTVTGRSVAGNITWATVKVEVFWSDTGDRSVTIQERVAFYAP